MKKQRENVEEMVENAREQYFDANVEVGRCHNTWREENVVGDANEQFQSKQNKSVREDRRITQAFFASPMSTFTTDATT